MDSFKDALLSNGQEPKPQYRGIMRLLTDLQAAQILGLSRSSVWKLMENGELPYVRVLRTRRIEESAIEAYIASRRSVGQIQG